jgi:hypothetical protein
MSVAPQPIEGGRDGIGSGDSYTELLRIPLLGSRVNKGLPLRSLRYEAAFSSSRGCKSLSM